MVVIELTLLIIGLATVISSLDFISKTTSNITHSLGIPEYLASTIILSFVVSIPAMILLFFSNFYDVPLFGFSVLIGFAITTITLVMGVFLYFNEVPIVYEGYRNATFMWSSALLLFVVSFDRFIDRVDAMFLLSLFVFYVIYITYRTGKSKEYVFFRRRPAHMILYPLSIFAIIVSSFLVLGASLNVDALLNIPTAKFGLLLVGPILAFPMFNVIRGVFGSSRLTFDNLLGNIVIGLTLIPGIVALIMPLPIGDGNFHIFSLLLLNVVCLSFAIITRLRESIYKKTGVILIMAFVFFFIHYLLM